MDYVIITKIQWYIYAENEHISITMFFKDITHIRDINDFYGAGGNFMLFPFLMMQEEASS